MELFHEAKGILEDELRRFQSFLFENVDTYTFDPADIEPIRQYTKYIQSKLTQDIGKCFEDAAKATMLPNWKMLFHVDNYIDTGRTLDEQRELIGAIIQSVETTGKVTHLPDGMKKVINSEFLDTEYRKSILLEELAAEYRLTDPTIDWISACLDRVRVMFYSVLAVGKPEIVREYADRAYTIFYDHKLDAIDNLFNKEEVEFLHSEAQKQNAIPEKEISQEDALRLLAWVAVVVSINDDFMDIEEDTENQKITGITCAVRDGLAAHTLQSTVIHYMEMTYSEIPQICNAQRWFREMVVLCYQDSQKCIETCREISPYLFAFFFQRK